MVENESNDLKNYIIYYIIRNEAKQTKILDFTMKFIQDFKRNKQNVEKRKEQNVV